MRTFLETVPANGPEASKLIERCKRLRREGWELSVLHRYRPRPVLIALGFKPTTKKSARSGGAH